MLLSTRSEGTQRGHVERARSEVASMAKLENGLEYVPPPPPSMVGLACSYILTGVVTIPYNADFIILALERAG